MLQTEYKSNTIKPMEKRFGALSSSQNPNEIANRVKGIILACSSAIILAAGLIFHIQLNANDVVTLATEISGVAGAVWTIYGFILWAISSIAEKKPIPSGNPTP